jgi:hypothetical protein
MMGAEHPPASSLRRCLPSLWAGTVLVVPLLWIFRRLFRGEVVEALDFLKWTLPSRALWRQALLQGRLLQWNPLSDLGSSVIYAPVHGVFYPGNLLLLIGGLPLSLSLLFVGHLLLTGIGGYRLARQLGCRSQVALSVGLAWELGYQLWMFGLGEKVLSGAWIPWAAVELVRASRSNRFASWSLVRAAGALALMALAGDPFLWLHALLLAGTLAWAASEDGERPPISRVMARLLGAVGLAALLAGPQLVPMLTLVPYSTRAGGLDRATAEMWSLNPVRLADLVAPGAVGSGYNIEWCAHFYFGLGLVLSIPWAGRSRLAAALWALVLLSVLLALGRHTPINDLLRRTIPPLAYLRYPEKYTLLTVSALALLGGLGLERALAKRTSLACFALPAGAALGIGLLAGATEYARMNDGTGLARTVAAVTVFICVLALSRWRPHLLWLLPVTAAIDLALFAEPEFLWLPETVVTQMPRSLRQMVGPVSEPPSRVIIDPGAQNPIPPNTAYLFNVGHVYALETARTSSVQKLLMAFDTQRSRASRLLDIAWWLRAGDQREGEGHPIRRLGAVDLVSLPATGRLRIVGRVRLASDEVALSELTTPQFDPGYEAILAPGPGARPLDTTPTGHCEHVAFEPEHVEITCHTSSEALLLMSEAHAAGWTAQVDGVPATVLRADVALRAVFLPAGFHRLRLDYRTPGLRWGFAFGGLGLAALCAIARRLRRASSLVTPAAGALPLRPESSS